MISAIRVIAFEPVSEIYQRLVTNVATNAFHGRCHPVQKAVSDVPGITRFFIPPGEIPTEASLELQNKSARKGGTHINIESTTLDTVCAQETVDFIKIDVEGAEHKVLQGARQLLARCRPTILLEHHANCPPHGIESVLKPYGYLFYGITEDGTLVPIEHLRHGIREHYLCSSLALEVSQCQEAAQRSQCRISSVRKADFDV
jgi:FkbM family methyltransferase